MLPRHLPAELDFRVCRCDFKMSFGANHLIRFDICLTLPSQYPSTNVAIVLSQACKAMR